MPEKIIPLGDFRNKSMMNLEIIGDLTGSSQVDQLRSQMKKMDSRVKSEDLEKFLDHAKKVRQDMRGDPRQYLTYLIIQPVQFLLGKIGPLQRDVSKEKQLQSQLRGMKSEHAKRFHQTQRTKDLFETKGKRVTVWARLRRLAYMLMDASK